MGCLGLKQSHMTFDFSNSFWDSGTLPNRFPVHELGRDEIFIFVSAVYHPVYIYIYVRCLSPYINIYPLIITPMQ